MSSLEDRLALLETQVHEIVECLEQIARDADLMGVNIMRTIGIRGAGSNPTQQEAAAVQETTFTTLRFDPAQGEKLGDYEIAYRASNIPDKFDYAYNILKASNATIKTRYHGAGYQFSYWIYGEGKIYRQKLKEAKA